MTTEVTKQIYKPSLTVGQVYARPYGSAVLPMPIGNVLELKLEHDEDVQMQEDMTQLGGGTHAEVRRVKQVKISMKLADLNVVNLARAVLGTSAPVIGGTVVAEAHVATLGGLLRLAHIQPTAVIVKKASVVIVAAGNYEVRAEGVYVLPNAVDILPADAVTVDYTYGAYAAIEALTTKAPELELTFGGLNEADSGNAVVVDIYRCSQGITKSLSLITKTFGALDVAGTVLMDASKAGVGVSRYYKVSMA
jgi:hypothetical protein